MNLYERLQQWRIQREPQTIILLYHRIAKVSSDPQLLCVTPEHFSEHLDILTKQYAPQPLRNLQRRRAKNRLPSANVIITFDDGYADNLLYAKPLLEKYGAPATVFVVSGQLGINQEFWWDALDRIFLYTAALPDDLELTIDEKLYFWNLSNSSCCEQNLDTKAYTTGWNVLLDTAPTPRHNAYREIASLLRGQASQTQNRILSEISSWAGSTPQRPEYASLDSAGVIALAVGGLVEIGAHTVTHPVLSALSAESQQAEISQSKSLLEELLGQQLQSFSYPFGSRNDYTAETINLVRQAGFKLACANCKGLVTKHSDPYQLPRFLIRDWDGENFARHLHEWLHA